jgi:hypothetical protein
MGNLFCHYRLHDSGLITGLRLPLTRIWMLVRKAGRDAGTRYALWILAKDRMEIGLQWDARLGRTWFHRWLRPYAIVLPRFLMVGIGPLAFKVIVFSHAEVTV